MTTRHASNMYWLTEAASKTAPIMNVKLAIRIGTFRPRLSLMAPPMRENTIADAIGMLTIASRHMELSKKSRSIRMIASAITPVW